MPKPHNTTELIHTAKQYMTPNYAPPAFVAHHGQGSWLWDQEGNKYLDFAGGIGVNALGHAHPQVVAAIAQQAALLCHASNLLYHEPYIELCAKLAELSKLQRAFLCNSGTEAVEAALKLARRYYFDKNENRFEFVCCTQGFHGRTYGALSTTGQPQYQKGFGPLLPGVHFVPFNNLTAMEQAVGEHTAAVLVEPIQGNGGVLIPDATYLSQLHALCKQRGCLLIVDEVQTGIGRTGKWFAYQYEQVIPDIICVAKAIGGGLPLAGILTHDHLAQTLQPGTHASTFGGNPIACAAALATIEVIETNNLLVNAMRMGELYYQQLTHLANKYPDKIKEIRGRGLLLGIVLQEPAANAQIAMRKLGLLTTSATSHVIRLFPPLNVSEAELTHSLKIIEQCLSNIVA